MAAGQFSTAYNDQIFTLTSVSSSRPQYSFIIDVYKSGSSDRLARLKTVPNAADAGVFNLGPVFQANLDYDQNWKIEGTTENTQSSTTFDIRYGEEYGTSLSSSVTVYPDQLTLYYNIFNGTSDSNVTNDIDFNPQTWDSSSFEDNGKPRLSNNTSYRIVTTGSYETLSIFGGDLAGGISATGSRFYSASIVFPNNPSASYSLTVPYASTTPTNVLTIGVGLPNITGSVNTTPYPFYDVVLHYTGSNISPSTASFRYYNASFPSDTNVWFVGASMAGQFAEGASAGGANDALLFGGINYTLVGASTTHKWNGTSWSNVAVTPYSVDGAAGAGNSTNSVIGVGGDIHTVVAHSNQASEYNGSTWSTLTNYPINVAFLDGAGVDADDASFVGGQVFQGVNYGGVASHYHWNGSAWSSRTNLNEARSNHVVIGSSADDFTVIAGFISSSNAIGNNVEQWNGSTFTNLSNYPISVLSLNGSGTSNDLMTFGGTISLAFTSNPATVTTDASYRWDGSAWASDAPLLKVTAYHGSAGTSNNTFAAGGGYYRFGQANPTDMNNNAVPSGQNSPVMYYTAYTLEVELPDMCYNETRFAFINQYGVWDYYSIFNPLTKLTNVDYSISTPTTSWSVSNRGKETYYSKYQDRYQITTDFLDQNTSDWLTELIESPSVFLQQGDDFVPVVITNANYQWKTNPRGQKIFQYTIEFAYSNNRTSVY